MADRSLIVTEIMEEIGKSSPQVRTEVDRIVGEVTLDILQQNDSRFRKLRKTYPLTVNTTDKEYKLPADFKTATKFFIQVDSAGEYVGQVEIVTESEFWRRKGDSQYGGNYYAKIEVLVSHASGAGEYLVFNALHEDTSYYEFPYYRKPTEHDTDIIENSTIIKEGVRGMLSKYIPTSTAHLTTYTRMKSGVRESPTERATGMAMMPSKVTRNLNRLLHKIGRGR